VANPSCSQMSGHCRSVTESPYNQDPSGSVQSDDPHPT
jgi:hypothetical protein